MTGVLHLERVVSGPDAATMVALLALEAATQERPLGPEGLLREAAEDGVLVLARDGDARGPLVGFASARLLVDEAHVMRLAVVAERRREGIGRALLDALIMWAQGIAAHALVLEVRAGNTGALQLYAEAGLTLDGRRPRYYPGGEDALLLRRVLDGADGSPSAGRG